MAAYSEVQKIASVTFWELTLWTEPIVVRYLSVLARTLHLLPHLLNVIRDNHCFNKTCTRKHSASNENTACVLEINSYTHVIL